MSALERRLNAYGFTAHIHVAMTTILDKEFISGGVYLQSSLPVAALQNLPPQSLQKNAVELEMDTPAH